MTDVTIRAADGGSFTAYLARPRTGGDVPGIVVAQEIFGVNDVIRGLCDDLAAQGYLAICPDLFWRQQPGIQISDKEMPRAFELYQGFNEAKGVEDLIAALAVLRRTEGCNGRAGALGYCLGGKLAYLMATRSDADCSVGYYGVAIERALDEASAITRPLMLHVAEQDGFCTPEAQAQIKAALASNPKVTIHTYPGMDHAFARPGGAHWDADAAALANGRTREFFRQNLTAAA